MDIEIDEIYQHYKGGIYKVIALAKHTESLEELVVYQAMYGNQDIWCRPISMWNDDIDYNGKIVKRFQLIKD